MPMKLDLMYTNEELSAALHTLAIGPGRIRERILNAYTASLSLLEGRELAPAVASDVAILLRKLGAARDENDQPSVPLTLEHMTEDEATHLAIELHELEYKARAAKSKS